MDQAERRGGKCRSIVTKYRNLIVTTALAATLTAGPALAEKYGLGREATPAEIAAWDIDITPDGTGLPEGSGDVWTGEELFADYCAVCHGDFAEGVGNWPKLADGDDTLDHEDPLKTVGSYWPYLSTVFDYVRRSMPFGNAQTLTDDEVYAITAYILYSNYLVEDDFTLTHENFMDVEMPNADGFFIDNREEVEAHFWNAEPCMENCKEGAVEITMRAAVLDVTPEETKARKVQEMIEATDPKAARDTEVEVSASTEEQQEAAAVAAGAQKGEVETPAEEAHAAIDAELAAEGENVFRQCKACHMVGEGAKNRVGPQLNAIVGADAGAVEGFRYSKSLEEAAEGGLVWPEEELAAFLEDPRGYMKRIKMAFAGLRDEEDVRAVIEYLKTFGS